MKTTHRQDTLFPDINAQYDGRVDSPFRYPGGKFYALKFIMPFINAVEHDEYREPFVGGGAAFFAKKKSQFNWLNDLDRDLMVAYQVMADPHLRSELAERLGRETATRARHREVKDLAPTGPLEAAFRTYYLNRTSFSGILHKPAWGYKIGQSVQPKGWPKKVWQAGRKLEGVRLTALDFEDVLKAPPEGKRVFMYVDPPYYQSDQKRAYEKSFAMEDHNRLLNLLRKTEYPFCLSYDDCPDIRRMYSWAEIYTGQWWYNTANCRGTPRKKGKELIITNYPVKRYVDTKLHS